MAQRRAQVDLLRGAVRWALLHPSSDGTQQAPDAAVLTEDGGCEPIAGPGCPGVSEYAVAEFAAALGVGSGPAKSLLGQALQLSHRLPRLWQRVEELDVDVDVAREVAASTVAAHPALTAEAADWVDQKVAPIVGHASAERITAVLEEAYAQFGLAVEVDEDVPPVRTHVRVRPCEDPYAGLATVEAVLDLADALDLEQAVAAGAAEMAEYGEAPEEERRAASLGELARRQTSLALGGSAARRVDLTLHFGATADADGAVRISPTGVLLDHAAVLLEQVRGWSAGTHTEVHVHPVPAQARLSAFTGGARCRFPWCELGRSISEGDAPAPLCRDHEGVVTAGWTVDDLGAHTLLWTSPSGDRYRCDAGGTTALTPAD